MEVWYLSILSGVSFGEDESLRDTIIIVLHREFGIPLPMAGLLTRLEGLFLGAAVGDAASQTIEWIYDLGELTKALDGRNPEFLPMSKCPFFTIPTGQNSCYFHQTATVAESLLACRGFDIEDLSQRFFTNFGPNTLTKETEPSNHFKDHGAISV